MSQLTRSNSNLLFPGVSVLLAILCQGLLLFGLARWFAEPAGQIQKKILIRLLKPVASIPETIAKKPVEPRKPEVKSPVVQEIPTPPVPLEKANVVESQLVIEKTPTSKKVPAVKPQPARLKPVKTLPKVNPRALPRPLPKPPLKSLNVQAEKIKIIAAPPQNSVIQKVNAIPDSSQRQQILPGKTSSKTTEKSPDTATKEALATDPDKINAYLNRLRLIMQKNLRYPSAARRRNISGSVMVSFQVKNDGSIFNTRIKSGADRLLKKASLELVEKIPIPLPPHGWQETFVIEIPLKYFLK